MPHVHVHVIPRGGPGDRFRGEGRNDELYPELQRSGAELDGDLLASAAAAGDSRRRSGEKSGSPLPPTTKSASATAPDPFRRERKDRTLEEMEAEASALRELF